MVHRDNNEEFHALIDLEQLIGDGCLFRLHLSILDIFNLSYCLHNVFTLIFSDET